MEINYDQSLNSQMSALDEAHKTVHGITGMEVTDMTAKVDSG